MKTQQKIETPERPSDLSNVGMNQTKRLSVHPLNKKVYGDSKPDALLIESVREHGILNPIVLNRSKQILSGTRRWLAAQIVGLTNVPIICLRPDKDDATRDELFLIESNKARVKTVEQKAREFKELKRIEAALAKQRMESGKKADPAPNSTQGTKGKAAAKAAEAVGLGRTTAEKLEKLVDAADAGDAKAKEALADIDSKKGRGVDSAFKNVFVPEPAEPLAPIPNAWDILVKDDRPERLGQVGKLVALFKNSDLRGALGTSAVSDSVPDTLNRFNLTVHCDAATLKTIRNVVGNAPAVKFMGLTARQVELIAEACSVKADKEKIA